MKWEIYVFRTLRQLYISITHTFYFIDTCKHYLYCALLMRYRMSHVKEMATTTDNDIFCTYGIFCVFFDKLKKNVLVYRIDLEKKRIFHTPPHHITLLAYRHSFRACHLLILHFYDPNTNTMGKHLFKDRFTSYIPLLSSLYKYWQHMDERSSNIIRLELYINFLCLKMAFCCGNDKNRDNEFFLNSWIAELGKTERKNDTKDQVKL